MTLVPDQQRHRPPSHIASSLPSLEHLRDVLHNKIQVLEAGTKLVRAAWTPESIFPSAVSKSYRFGPPAELCQNNGHFPWFWLYAANDPMTAIWEAQLCKNDCTTPGTFYMANGSENALLVTIELKAPILIFDLMETVSSTLGIYDALSSPDYEWCQWLGWQINEILSNKSDQKIHGFRYPSRKHRGATAYAFTAPFSPTDKDIFLITHTVKFGDSPQYEELLANPCYRAMPK